MLDLELVASVDANQLPRKPLKRPFGFILFFFRRNENLLGGGLNKFCFLSFLGLGIHSAKREKN